MSRKKLIAAAAFSAALAGGGVAGALLGTPGISGAAIAQTATESSSSADTATAPAPEHRGGPGLDAAAKALGMSVDDLRTELEGGKTIAQVAGEKGVDVNTVIDAMVASATDDLRAHITDFVNNGAPMGGHGPGHGGPGMHGPGHPGGPHLDAAAKALGISADDLRTELEGGKTIAQVASEKGVDVQTVIDAVTADENAEIDQRLADGDITQAQADEMKAAAAQHATDIVNGTMPKAGPGFPGGRGHGGPRFGPPADDASSSATTS